MCELLVRVVDKVNDDPVKDAQCHKAGDVIVAVPDGWQWGRAEVASADWRIVRVPDMSIEEAQGLLEPEPRVEGLPDSATRRKRAFRLYLAALADTMTAAEVRAARYRVRAH